MAQGITIKGKTASGQSVDIRVDSNGIVQISGDISVEPAVGASTEAKQDDIITQLPLKAGIDYDYLDIQQTDPDTETFVFKLGGSGGADVLTVVVNYTDATKATIDNVSWSL